MDISNINTTRVRELRQFKLFNDRVEFPLRLLPYIETFLGDKTEVFINGITCNIDSSIIIPDSLDIIELLEEVQINQYNLDIWYPKLPPLMTFESVLIPLTVDDIDEIVRIGKLLKWREWQPIDYDNIHNLYERIQTVIDHHLSKFNSFFLRTNTVSPKDVCIGSYDLNNANYIDSVRQNSYAKGPLKRLCVRTADEVLYILTNSRRVINSMNELSRATRCNFFIVLRDWLPDLPYEFEFRCFVYKGKLTAISQYDWVKYCELFQSDEVKKWIVSKIVAFWEATKDIICGIYSDCIMDLIITDHPSVDCKYPTYNNLGVILIEFNPFGGELISGSALFGWEKDYDIIYIVKIQLNQFLK